MGNVKSTPSRPRDAANLRLLLGSLLLRRLLLLRLLRGLLLLLLHVGQLSQEHLDCKYSTSMPGEGD
jgi:hypothetical protein